MTGGRQKRPKVQLKNWHLAHGTFQSPEKKLRKLIMGCTPFWRSIYIFFSRYVLSIHTSFGGKIALLVK